MTLDEWAAEIYAAFPKKVDRARALVAIKRCLTRRRVTARQLLQYTEAYANHVRPLRDTDGWGVVLQPATYYNGERWNDRVGDRATDQALKQLLAERKKREVSEVGRNYPGIGDLKKRRERRPSWLTAEEWANLRDEWAKPKKD